MTISIGNTTAIFHGPLVKHFYMTCIPKSVSNETTIVYGGDLEKRVYGTLFKFHDIQKQVKVNNGLLFDY